MNQDNLYRAVAVPVRGKLTNSPVIIAGVIAIITVAHQLTSTSSHLRLCRDTIARAYRHRAMRETKCLLSMTCCASECRSPHSNDLWSSVLDELTSELMVATPKANPRKYCLVVGYLGEPRSHSYHYGYSRTHRFGQMHSPCVHRVNNLVHR